MLTFSREKPRWLELRLLVSAILLIGELCICLLAFNPDVEPDYRAHFLMKPSRCWLSKEAKKRLETMPVANVIEVGSLSWPQRCGLLRMGWSAEHWGAWSIGTRAELRIPIGQDTSAVQLNLLAPGYRRGGQAVILTLEPDGQPMQFIIPPDHAKRIMVDLPGVARLRSEADILIDVAAPRSPASYGFGKDRRLLGVGLVDIRLQ